MKGYVPPPRLSLSNEPQPITRNITITEGISVKDLAEKLGIRAKDLIARLLVRGVFATINQTLDAELASEMARFFGAETNVISFEEQAQKEIAEAAATSEDGATEAVPRPPVVTISVRTKCRCRIPSLRLTDARSCSSTRPVTKPLRACARGAQSLPTLWCWSWQPTTA